MITTIWVASSVILYVLVSCALDMYEPYSACVWRVIGFVFCGAKVWQALETQNPVLFRGCCRLAHRKYCVFWESSLAHFEPTYSEIIPFGPCLKQYKDVPSRGRYFRGKPNDWKPTGPSSDYAAPHSRQQDARGRHRLPQVQNLLAPG